jgi:diguanylate cyclase (GGDEF)-like protein
LKIGEFARLADVSTKMLRHYDAIDLLKPQAIDHENGYRFYHENQLSKLNWIVTLKNLDFSLHDIKTLLGGPVDSAAFLTAIAQKRIEIANALNEQLVKSIQIEHLFDLVKQEGFQMNRNIDLLTLTTETVHDIKKNMPNLEMMYEKAKTILSSTLAGNTFGLLRMDLRQFKTVNDVDGYDVGDKVIVALYQTLETVLSRHSNKASMARAGGDEFAIILEGKKEEIEVIAHEFKTEVNAINYKVLGCHKPVEIYIAGIVSSNTAYDHFRELLDQTQEVLLDARQDAISGGKGIKLIERT